MVTPFQFRPATNLNVQLHERLYDRGSLRDQGPFVVETEHEDCSAMCSLPINGITPSVPRIPNAVREFGLRTQIAGLLREPAQRSQRAFGEHGAEHDVLDDDVAWHAIGDRRDFVRDDRLHCIGVGIQARIHVERLLGSGALKQLHCGKQAGKLDASGGVGMDSPPAPPYVVVDEGKFSLRRVVVTMSGESPVRCCHDADHRHVRVVDEREDVPGLLGAQSADVDERADHSQAAHVGVVVARLVARRGPALGEQPLAQVSLDGCRRHAAGRQQPRHSHAEIVDTWLVDRATLHMGGGHVCDRSVQTAQGLRRRTGRR